MGGKHSKHGRRHYNDDSRRNVSQSQTLGSSQMSISGASTSNITDSKNNQNYRNKIVSSNLSLDKELERRIAESNQEAGRHEQIIIEDNSIGHGYQMVFGRFLDKGVTSVLIEDPYIRKTHQCQNLLRLSELLIKSCPSFVAIHLVTVHDPQSEQSRSLGQLKKQLARRKVTLTISYSHTLHDRQIKLSNGWIIKIGRGLDYFKPPGGKFSVGFFDLDLRPCHATTVDAFHQKDIRATIS